MAKLYPTIYASILCLALIFVHKGDAINCGRTAHEDATSVRKACIQSGTGGCGERYANAFRHHQRTCNILVGRRSGDLATFLDETHDSPAIENRRNTNDDKFNALMNRLRNVAVDVEDDLPLWLQEAEDNELDTQRAVPHDSFQRLLARL